MRPSGDEADEENERRRRRSRDDEGQDDAPAVAALAPDAAGQASDIPAPGASVLDTLATAEPPEHAAPPPPAPPPPEAAVPAMPRTPARPVAEETARPLMVSSDKVNRRSGSFPDLQSARRGELPGRLKALLCIDNRGAVTSVKLYDKLRTPVRAELEKALRGWRYAPYQESGKAVPACFGLTFRTVVH